MSDPEFSKQELQNLYQEWHKSLYNFALRLVFNEATAEELVHETFMKLWKNRDEVRREQVKSLLFKVLQNSCINFIKREKVWKTIQKMDFLSVFMEENFETKIVESQEILKLREHMEKIPQKYRQVLLLYYYGEFSYDEIAKILEVSEGTVASRKNRALKMLKNEFSREMEYAL